MGFESPAPLLQTQDSISRLVNSVNLRKTMCTIERNLGLNHNDDCDGAHWRYSGEGYDRVRLCSCGAEDHDPEIKEVFNQDHNHPKHNTLEENWHPNCSFCKEEEENYSGMRRMGGYPSEDHDPKIKEV